MSERPAMMFVDGQNLFHGAKQYQDGYKYDHQKLRDVLMEEYYTVRAYWFDSYKDSSNKQGFFDSLRMNGYRVISKPLRQRDGEHVGKRY